MKDNFKVFKPAGKMQFEFTDLIAGADYQRQA